MTDTTTTNDSASKLAVLMDKVAGWSLKVILIFIIFCLGTTVVYLYKQNSSLYDRLVINSAEAASAKAKYEVLIDHYRLNK